MCVCAQSACTLLYSASAGQRRQRRSRRQSARRTGNSGAACSLLPSLFTTVRRFQPTLIHRGRTTEGEPRRSSVQEGCAGTLMACNVYKMETEEELDVKACMHSPQHQLPPPHPALLPAPDMLPQAETSRLDCSGSSGVSGSLMHCRTTTSPSTKRLRMCTYTSCRMHSGLPLEVGQHSGQDSSGGRPLLSGTRKSEGVAPQLSSRMPRPQSSWEACPLRSPERCVAPWVAPRLARFVHSSRISSRPAYGSVKATPCPSRNRRTQAGRRAGTRPCLPSPTTMRSRRWAAPPPPPLLPPLAGPLI